MKYKTQFEAILIRLNEAKFNYNSEQFEFVAHAGHYVGCEIVQ